MLCKQHTVKYACFFVPPLFAKKICVFLFNPIYICAF